MATFVCFEKNPGLVMTEKERELFSKCLKLMNKKKFQPNEASRVWGLFSQMCALETSKFRIPRN